MPSRKARATINTLRRELTSQAELSSAAEDKGGGGRGEEASRSVEAVPEMVGNGQGGDSIVRSLN